MAIAEVLSGRERRRRWSEEQRREIIEASLVPGAALREVARRFDVSPSLIYRWRREAYAAEGFVLVAASEPVPAAAAPAVELVIAGDVSLRIPASTPPALAAAIVGALAKR